MSDKMIVKVEGTKLTLEQQFDAPQQLVFRAYTEAEHLKQWWGPRGWELPLCTVDLRPGGVWHYCMKCMDQNQGDFYLQESWGKGVYHEVEAGERIVYTDYFSDAEGNEAEGMPSSRITVTFTDQGGQTLLSCSVEYSTEEELQQVIDMGMIYGITETWERLTEHLASLQ